MANDPFLEAGISVPDQLPYSGETAGQSQAPGRNNSVRSVRSLLNSKAGRRAALGESLISKKKIFD